VWEDIRLSPELFGAHFPDLPANETLHGARGLHIPAELQRHETLIPARVWRRRLMRWNDTPVAQGGRGPFPDVQRIREIFHEEFPQELDPMTHRELDASRAFDADLVAGPPAAAAQAQRAPAPAPAPAQRAQGAPVNNHQPLLPRRVAILFGLVQDESDSGEETEDPMED